MKEFISKTDFIIKLHYSNFSFVKNLIVVSSQLKSLEPKTCFETAREISKHFSR